MLNKIERETLFFISNHELAVSKAPFLEIAAALSMTEEGLLGVLSGLREKGIINCLRGVIDPVIAGYKESALIAWRVSSEKIEAQAAALIENDLISHCYERQAGDKELDYNIFSMMHARDRGGIETFAAGVCQDFNADYALLFTAEELKKEKPELKEFLSTD
jgi:DNA-binding Lrp family transcriptional regulator